MDALAGRGAPALPMETQFANLRILDLASMQQQQQAARQNAGGLRDPQVYQAQRPSIRYARSQQPTPAATQPSLTYSSNSLQNIPRTLSGNSVSDITMMDSPPRQKVFASESLDAASIEELKQLDQRLRDNPFEYETHSRYITILHQGLQYHMYPGDGTSKDGNTYEMLDELRDAFRAMDKIYPLGEALWEYWISDEKALARNIGERLEVEQYFQRALKDEPKSIRIWRSYGEYMSFCYSCAHDENPPQNWSFEDREVGSEVFTFDVMIGVWERGAEATMHNPKESHLIWDRYAQYLLDDLQRNYSPEKSRRISLLFEDRLSKPHATWDSTFQLFSTFNSQYNASTYEEVMEVTGKRTANAKKLYRLRDKYEFSIDKALQDQDRYAEHTAYTKYLRWEKKSAGPFSFHLVVSLFERALLRFPTDVNLWEDFVEFLISKPDQSVSTLEVAERATRHCPWSGSLWNHRILTLEAENRDFNEIEHVKHNATKTGLLEHSGLDDLIKVQTAWCGYLRRKAFDNPQSSDEDVDIAEMGIRSALDDVREVGVKKYGEEYKGDPQYRLERIHIKFLTQNGNVEGARSIWNSLVPQHKNYYEFWYRYYIWEMVIWSNHAVRDRNAHIQQLKTPENATKVLEDGLRRATEMDYPEQLIQMYVNHCEQHESVQSLRNAMITARKWTSVVLYRRTKEAEQAGASAGATQAPVQPTTEQHAEETNAASKRKREDAAETDHDAKKNRQQEHLPSTEIAPPATLQTSQKEPQRDREHTTVIVKGLPEGTDQQQVRKFFSDCGTLRSIITKDENDSVTATVEFQAPEEAQYALMKEAKGFNGTQISITMGASTTLYVTNYPPTADEDWIRKLFSPFGEILQVRFPSLKFNSHRRFCYVQFTRSQDAVAAERALDGKNIDGLNLLAKLSNPNVKKQRESATDEGREVYIWHLEFHVNQKEIKEAFGKFGNIESVKLPKTNKGTNKGYCYVVFEKKEDADEAVKEMDGKVMRGLDLHVEIAKKAGETLKGKYKSVVRLSATPNPEGGAGEDGEKVASSANKEAKAPPVPFTQRSVTLLNIPDIVHEARISQLVQPYHPKKLEYYPGTGSAVIEFTNQDDSGKAALALDGFEILPGKRLRVGEPGDEKRGKAEHEEEGILRTNREQREIEEQRKKEIEEQPMYMKVGTGIRKKAKVGVKKGGIAGKFGVFGTAAATGANAGPVGPPGGQQKSNEDFRRMMEAGRGGEEQVDGDGKGEEGQGDGKMDVDG